MCGLSAVTSISDSRISLAIRSRSGSIPTAQLSLKLRQRPRATAHDARVVDDERLEDVQLEVAHRAAQVHRHVVGHHLAQSMVIASLWVGFTLPGMIELPGSFSGILISPRPERGPDASQRTSFAIFIRETASVFSAP